jgi:hypothetical protein
MYSGTLRETARAQVSQEVEDAKTTLTLSALAAV